MNLNFSHIIAYAMYWLACVHWQGEIFHQLWCDSVHMAHDGPHTAAGKLVSAELTQPPGQHALLLRLGAERPQRARQQRKKGLGLIPRACRTSEGAMNDT